MSNTIEQIAEQMYPISNTPSFLEQGIQFNRRLGFIAGATYSGLTELVEALEKIKHLKTSDLNLGESWYDRLTDATTTAANALSNLKSGK